MYIFMEANMDALYLPVIINFLGKRILEIMNKFY